MSQLSAHSRALFLNTADLWSVPRDDFAMPMLNYLYYGFPPGGFFTSVLANDLNAAVNRAHPHITIEILRSLTSWINADFPKDSYGSYQAVSNWGTFEQRDRRKHLELYKLIFDEESELMFPLKGLEPDMVKGWRYKNSQL